MSWEWVGLSRERAIARKQSRLQGLGRPSAVIHVEQTPHARGLPAQVSWDDGRSAHAHGASRTALLSLCSVAPVPLILPGDRLQSPHPGWSSWVTWSCSWRRVSERRLSSRRSSKRSGGRVWEQSGRFERKERERPHPSGSGSRARDELSELGSASQGPFGGPHSYPSLGTVRCPAVLSLDFTSFPNLESPSQYKCLQKRKLQLRDAFLVV